MSTVAGVGKTKLAVPSEEKARRRRKFKIWFWSSVTVISLPIVVGGFVFNQRLNKASLLIHNLPSIMEQVNSQASTILSSDGETLYSVQGQYRRPVSIENVPQFVINATVAAEDKRFWEHDGVDFKAMTNLAFLTLWERSIPRGGSTLSMQIAKRVYTNPEKTLDRKLDDMALAVMIERNLTKYQILELYLNQVYYGKQAYGIGAAADVYFGKKNLYDLTLGEAAMLARLVRRPSDENPFDNLDVSVKNRNIVLGLMRDENMISKDEYNKALKEKPKLSKERPQTVSGRKLAPYFADEVMREVKEEFPDVDFKAGGYTIETTLNWKLQEYAEKVVADALKSLKGQKVTTAAMFLTDSDGAVLVHIGGGDYDTNQFDVITQGARQPGSAFKPFLYATAFERGLIAPQTMISKAPYYWLDNGKPVMVHNSDGDYTGEASVELAIMKSTNTCAARVMEMTGPGNVVALAKNAFGFKSDLAAVPALALGSTAVSPLEMARAYSVFKNDGDRVEPYFIRKITGPDGQVMKRYGSRIVRSVISKNTANTMDTILYKDARGGTAFRVTNQEGVINARGKTGTTNDFRDGWFCGYTSRFLGIAWVGSEVRKGDGWIYPSMLRVFGGSAAAPFWGKIVRRAQETLGEERLAFQPSYSLSTVNVDAGANKGMFEELPPLDPNKIPPIDDQASGRTGPPVGNTSPPIRNGSGTDTTLDIVYVEVCADTGLRATAYCPERVKKPFLKGTEPKGTCTLHHPPK